VAVWGLNKSIQSIKYKILPPYKLKLNITVIISSVVVKSEVPIVLLLSLFIRLYTRTKANYSPALASHVAFCFKGNNNISYLSFITSVLHVPTSLSILT
jgi:hypothetical protein